jgi:hypothetical protein
MAQAKPSSDKVITQSITNTEMITVKERKVVEFRIE